MKIGLGLYRHQPNRAHYDFARQCSATHLVIRLADQPAMYQRLIDMDPSPDYSRPVGVRQNIGASNEMSSGWPFSRVISRIDAPYRTLNRPSRFAVSSASTLPSFQCAFTTTPPRARRSDVDLPAVRVIPAVVKKELGSCHQNRHPAPAQKFLIAAERVMFPHVL